ncbi:hypothetical protein RPYSC3_25620 [Rhodopseudomonas palustris]|nr:hypothetical protein RPYSC3_25620 [Rhodopseudomonas palustris]
MGGGQFWKPIPRLKGSNLHAETHLAYNILRAINLVGAATLRTSLA